MPVVLSTGLGWRWIFRLPVLALLAGGVAYCPIARDSPQDLGFQSPGEGEEGAGQMARPTESSAERYRAVCLNPRFLIACCAIGFQSVARYGLLVWVPVHFLGGGWQGDPLGRWVSTALPVGMALGALCSGWVSDRYFRGRRSNGIARFMALAGVAAAGMYLCPGRSAAGIVLLFLCGFLVYGPQSRSGRFAPTCSAATAPGPAPESWTCSRTCSPASASPSRGG